jgi:hypothetical protein
MKKTGRNDPCPCGSGKKFKKCHGDAGKVSPPIAAALKAYFEESQKIESQTFETIGNGLSELVGELWSFDRISCVTAIAALQSIAGNRNSIVRLDALLHLAAIHCCGIRPVDVRSLDRWLNRFLAASLLSHREDPAEDVAIGNVMTTSGNYRVFNGDSSHPDSQRRTRPRYAGVHVRQSAREALHRALMVSWDFLGGFRWEDESIGDISLLSLEVRAFGMAWQPGP